MDREKESPPERLPFCLDDTVGEIVRASQECPGVYYIAARKQDGKFLADEYYVVEKSSPAISKEAMVYGRMPEEDSRVLLYSFAEERRGYKIIEYEIYRYQVRHGIYADGQTSLRDIAFYNMEYHPEYFGTYPVPLATPQGRTARYKPLMNGVFWIETGTGEEVLAVCYPIWNCDFSETVLKQSEQTEEDVREGIDSTLGYLFFSKWASSLALFELWGQYEELRAGGLINYPALMNYIWTYFPEYAATYNIQNQMGMHDTFGLLMNALGAEMELQNDPSKVIAMSKAAGLDFLNF